VWEVYTVQMNSNPLISIVVPVFNGENFIRDSLKSILNQEYENFEVLVIDDGSDDPNSILEIVNEFKDERINFFRQSNGGVAAALNFAIRKMKGDYFAWLSHDDLFAKNKIKIQVEELVTLNDENVILFSGYQIIDENGKYQNEVDFKLQLPICDRLGGIERGMINGCTVLISKKILDEVGYFDETLRHTQDYDYWLRCLISGKVFKYIPRNLVSTRIHAGQDSRKHKKLAQLESEILWLRILEFWVSRERGTTETKIKEMLDFREFLQIAGFSLAEQSLNEKLLSYISDIKVSVIIPVANRNHLLRVALGSLRAQLHKNFEVIIVNDSPAEDLDLIAIINESNLNYKYVKNVKNLGAGESRNIGIKEASGDFICFLDSDDFFTPDKLSDQLFKMIAEGVDISHTSYFSRSTRDNRHQFRDTSNHVGAHQALYIAAHGCSIATPTVMIKGTLLKSFSSPFPITHSPGEDISAWIRLLHASELPLQHIKTPLTVVRVHTNSAAIDAQAQIDSEILIRKTLDSLGINQTKIMRVKSEKIGLPLLLNIVNGLGALYIRLPDKLRKVIRRNTFLAKLYSNLRNKAGFS
jgi:glycosyltransferase involved in cell wall biosynthesis